MLYCYNINNENLSYSYYFIHHERANKLLQLNLWLAERSRIQSTIPNSSWHVYFVLKRARRWSLLSTWGKAWGITICIAIYLCITSPVATYIRMRLGHIQLHCHPSIN